MDRELTIVLSLLQHESLNCQVLKTLRQPDLWIEEPFSEIIEAIVGRVAGGQTC